MIPPSERPDPHEVAWHMARYNDPTLTAWDRMQSRLWLIDRGVIEHDQADDPPEPPHQRKPLDAQGNPTPEVLAREREKARERKPSQAVMVKVSSVAKRPVEWLWPDTMALGKITVFSGDPGVGKSFLTVSLAAIVSAGGSWPGRPDEPVPACDVVMLSAEDAVADTIRPRLEDAGADLDRVHVLTSVKRCDGTLAPFSIRTDLPVLEAAIAELRRVRLVIIDPVSSYMGGVDQDKNGDMRSTLDPLKDFAERNRVALGLVTHLNKGNGLKAIYRSTGSLALVAAARTYWYVDRDPSDRRRRRMLPSKSNLSEILTGLSYRIIDGAIQWDPEPLNLTADEALQQERDWLAGAGPGRDPKFGDGSRGPSAQKRKQCEDWLRERLSGDYVLLSALLIEGRRQGLTRATIGRALSKIGAESIETEGVKFFRLPPQLPLAEGPDSSS